MTTGLFFVPSKGVLKNYCPRCLSIAFSETVIDTFLKDLNYVPWSIIESTNDVNDALHLWESLFKSIADEHAPMQTKRVKGKQSPWIMKKLLEIWRDCDYHKKKARILNSKYNWQMH